MADINSIYCPNCRKETSLSIRKEYGSHGKLYQIAECNSCNYFFLVARYGQNEKIIEIYPSQLPKPIDPRIPVFLKGDLEEAYKCFSVKAYRGTGVLARRALQMCCIEKGAPDKRLVEQIDWLLDERIITNDLKEWAHEVRLTGNDAAHPPKDVNKDSSVTEDDAKDILFLLEELIKVLYITPAIAKERKEKRIKDKNKE